MVSVSRIEDVPAQILSASVRKTIQSIKEIVGNHSEADIYTMLKETNMDPNETVQKLLTQGHRLYKISPPFLVFSFAYFCRKLRFLNWVCFNFVICELGLV